MRPIREGRVIAGKYQLERPLARGGMGSIWVARHLLLESTVAIKFIEPRLANLPEARGRFEREAKVAAQLQGAHLVQIQDYGIEDNIPYMVMERLHGEDLSTRLNREKRLSVLATSDIVRQVARVLRRAQEAGIVHRDLKPGNIFLVQGDEEEIVKVLDFGVAKIPRSISADEMTKSGMLLGSPRYMSPEQARGMKNIDHRSDLWSLAVIAFRAITGELPFPGDDIGDVLVKICVESAPAPSAFVPELSPEMDRFFERAFERDPAKRFQSARDFARAFSVAAGRAPLSSSAAELSVGATPIDVTPPEPWPGEASRESTTRDDKAPRRSSTNEIRTEATSSSVGTPNESPGGIGLSSIRARRVSRRRGRSVAVAAAILGASIGLILYAMFTRGPNTPPAAPPVAAGLAGADAQSPSAPAVVVDVFPSAAAVTALPALPAPGLDPPPASSASATPTAAPRPPPKLPSSKRRNPILGI